MLEIERKFLFPEECREKLGSLNRFSHKEITQGYLSLDPEVRIRKIGGTCVRTEKGPGGLVREETEVEISSEEFQRQLAHIQGELIEKTRYFIPLDDGLTAELDIFHGGLSGLRVVEVEFPSREAAERFCVPEWFGPDVTGDVRYRNKNLALHRLADLP